MTQPKSQDERARRNINMLEPVHEIAKGLIRARHMGRNKFSQLLTDLVLEAHRRQASGEDKNLSELLAENRKLREKVQDYKGTQKVAVEMLAEHKDRIDAANRQIEQLREALRRAGPPAT
jgi:polyhydroxyalkanoate synthesis regulator phasin